MLKFQYGSTFNDFCHTIWRNHFIVRRQPPSEEREKDWLVLWLIDSLIDWLTQSPQDGSHEQQEDSKNQQENVSEQKRSQDDDTAWIISLRKKHSRQDTWLMKNKN